MALYVTIQVHSELSFFLTASTEETFESVASRATKIYIDLTNDTKDTEKMCLCSKEGIYFPSKSKISEFERIFAEGSNNFLILRSKPVSKPLVGPSQLQQHDIEEQHLRIKLAAAYRIFEHYGWSEIIYNHLTVRIPGM